MAENLLDLLQDPQRYTEVVEGVVACIDAQAPHRLPIISFGHGACSDYLFVDIGDAQAPRLAKILVMHSSMTGPRDYGPDNEQEALKDFLAESATVLLVPVHRRDRANNRFTDRSEYLACRAGYSITTLIPIFVETEGTPGWHTLIDIDREDSLIIQVGGAIESRGILQPHNLLEHIREQLRTPGMDFPPRR